MDSERIINMNPMASRVAVTDAKRQESSVTSSESLLEVARLTHFGAAESISN